MRCRPIWAAVVLFSLVGCAESTSTPGAGVTDESVPPTRAPAPPTSMPAPATTEEAVEFPELGLGDEGEFVARLQRELTRHGYPLEADGVFGPVTDGAVRGFQAAHGLPVDGIVGREVWLALTTTEPLPRSTTVAAGPDEADQPGEPVAGTAVPLDHILDPIEAEYLAESDFTGYELHCVLLRGERSSDWIGWQRVEVGRDQIVGAGSVLYCTARTDPPADVSTVDLIVLDDHGAVTRWFVGTDEIGHVPAAPPGLLCREYIATEEFGFAADWMGQAAPYDDVLAYQWALAYWFLEGAPDRMDVDRNGVPCELVFDADVVAQVWGSNTPTPSASSREVTLRQVLDRYEDRAMQGGLYTSITIGPCGRSMSSLSEPDAGLDSSGTIERGDVIACLIDSEPIDEPGAILIIVLDDTGTTINTAATSGEWMQVFDVEPGLSCRGFLDVPDWAGWEAQPGLQWHVYELVLAYWFLEGEPDRLDLDADGAPCEEFFPANIVTDVLASGR